MIFFLFSFFIRTCFTAGLIFFAERTLFLDKTLHRRNHYVFPLIEGLNLPPHLAARANPKSSIGRIDVHVRLLTDDGSVFDNVPQGYSGKLWLEVYLRSFDVVVHEGDSLNQLRIFDSGLETLGNSELKCLHRDSGLLFGKSQKGKPYHKIENKKFEGLLERNTLGISLDLDREIPGFVARTSTPPVDLSRRDLPASEYFERAHKVEEGVIIGDDSFHVLSSLEVTNVPEGFCAEMAEIDTSSGEFRAHYAGFFDPAFKAQATLELRNFGGPLLLRHEQRIANIDFFRMKQQPEKPYGHGDKKSSYQGQEGPTLAKFFDVDK